MKYIKQISKYPLETSFLAIVVLFVFLYFFVEMTPSKLTWYKETYDQFQTYVYELTNIGR